MRGDGVHQAVSAGALLCTAKHEYFSPRASHGCTTLIADGTLPCEHSTQYDKLANVAGLWQLPFDTSSWMVLSHDARP